VKGTTMTNFRALVGLTIDKDDSSVRVEPGKVVPKLSEEQTEELLAQGAIEAVPPKTTPPEVKSTQNKVGVK